MKLINAPTGKSFHCLTLSPINNYRPKRKEEQTRKQMEPCWGCKNTCTISSYSLCEELSKEKNILHII